MPRFRNSVALAPVPRPLTDGVVGALLDALEKLPFADDGRLNIGVDVGDVRLVEGEHLAAGARYRIVPPDMEDEKTDIEVRVVSWNRTGESHVEITSEVDGNVITARLELRMAGRRAHTLRAEGDFQGGKPFRRFKRARWEAEVRFEEWWAVLGQRAAPISLMVRPPFASASLLIDRGKDKDERWTVKSKLRFSGRGIARPLVAVALLVVRNRVRRALRDGFAKAEAAWNDSVPARVERGLRERVTLKHQVEVKTVSREWVEEYVAALHRAIEELRFEKGRLADTPADVRLVEGEHIEAGAHYRFVSEGVDKDESLNVKVVAWDSAGPSRVEFSSPDEAQTGWAEIDSARKPAVIRAALSGEIEDLTQLSLAGEANLERWWAGVGGSGGEPPAFTATADHPLAEGGVSIAGSPADGDRWKVDTTVTVEGRDWARPLIAVADLVGGAAIEGAFKQLVDETAADWDRAVTRAAESDPRPAAEATIRKALEDEREDEREDDGPADGVQPN
ncbi:hypothetical protein E1281_34780 [Actinomadura sp. KC345]|uniref:hypothetical protein n=1 Tax=Actinomadura sp. KC345 TaxID=2530371 RepID=UPI00105239EA|nr:hypothetical protein [Actinomadura sp. KC345]TDC43772.1 hypothetical protein E1281_34780 [Actinomadura sp. KC345]